MYPYEVSVKIWLNTYSMNGCGWKKSVTTTDSDRYVSPMFHSIHKTSDKLFNIFQSLIIIF